MEFKEKLKNMRKKASLSQEQLAEKINVSRQAITKWETGKGTPDIANLKQVAALFQVSVDELLDLGKKELECGGFCYQSMTVYDIDLTKNYDIQIGNAKEIKIEGIAGEKIKIVLTSQTLKNLENSFKVKLDERKRNLDIEIKNIADVTQAQAKNELSIWLGIPIKLAGKVEISAVVKKLSVTKIRQLDLEFDGKVKQVWLDQGESHLEINASTDMEIICGKWQGLIDINQISATSIIHIPESKKYFARKKGFANQILFAVNSKPGENRSQEDADLMIELNGLKSELVINEYSDDFLEVWS